MSRPSPCTVTSIAVEEHVSSSPAARGGDHVENARIGSAVAELRVDPSVSSDDVAARSSSGVALELLHESLVIHIIAVKQMAQRSASIAPPEPRPTSHVCANLPVPAARQLVEDGACSGAIDRHPRVERLIAQPS
eukprot:CAMPEP_0119387256 /NCGR_PEP_ID=MMETSP1334-20130426/99879_1 /TAXON_ID=127549 /ORGANISM="Calcidiscus leptoporus, Strain RCC1130" /LENGTH=134 /DNA_ID=CAMNT_0007408943 /DNA_START=319 /DNA_END=719 /DNA_ORIENTATION=-